MAAPFSLWLLALALLFALLPQAAHASACPATSSSERVHVVYVYDGDTVKLSDGRRLRLIGINTPNSATKTRPPNPWQTRRAPGCRN